jgi:pimeloyl-ACP methyl ester carboxylesterase
MIFRTLIFITFFTLVVHAQSPVPKRLEVFGQKIHYVEAGTGPNVILLHGLADDWSVWEQTLPALKAKYRVWAIDQIGFGQSDKPFINYRVTVFVEFLHAFMKRAGIEKATLVGNSLGGWVAAAYTYAHPDRVEKLVLVNAAGYWPAGIPELRREELTQMVTSSPSAYRAMMQWMFYDDSLVTEAAVERYYTAQLKRNDGYTINQFIESVLRREDRLDALLPAIKTPTLVLWTRQDEATPLAIGQAFAKVLPNAQTTILERCGHLPQLECAAKLNEALLKFLASTTQTTAR